MTVLMFGWEFPPHISGGLGTACFGLTHALIEENIKVLFVVPKAYGDEEIKLIDASTVTIPEGEHATYVEKVTEMRENLMEIQVPSALIPYAMHEPMQIVERWNWEFQSQQTKVIKTPTGKKYSFTGLYGPLLFDEVHKYAEVSAAIANQHHFDLIHAHDWLTYPAAIEAKKISDKPLIVHVHATEFDRSGDKNVDDRVVEIEKRGMEAADAVIAVSQWTKDIIINKYGISKRKIHVVHNGVSSDRTLEFSWIPRISDKVVTFLGRITYQKGPQYFIEAARKVLERFPDAHFIMAGSGDLLPAMIDRVAQLKLSSRIHFTGFLKKKQVHQVWSVTDIYVMPSVSEPFGITALEAVNAGVPVVLSSQSGVAEVLDHAIKVDFWDVDALANAMINLLTFKSLAHSLKINGREELKSFTWKRAAKKIMRLYHEI